MGLVLASFASAEKAGGSEKEAEEDGEVGNVEGEHVSRRETAALGDEATREEAEEAHAQSHGDLGGEGEEGGRGAPHRHAQTKGSEEDRHVRLGHGEGGRHAEQVAATAGAHEDARANGGEGRVEGEAMLLVAVLLGLGLA